MDMSKLGAKVGEFVLLSETVDQFQEPRTLVASTQAEAAAIKVAVNIIAPDPSFQNQRMRKTISPCGLILCRCALQQRVRRGKVLHREIFNISV